LGNYLTRVRLDQRLRADLLLSDLNEHTGLAWTAHEERLSDGSEQTVLVASPFKTEVTIARSRRHAEALDVEFTPGLWPSLNYPFWQVLAALARMGGVHVFRDGTVSHLLLPVWIDTKWVDLSWWRRLRP
jgi:hypothetical protein